MSGDHNKYHMKVEIPKHTGVYLSAKEFNELREALEDAVYLLNPTDEDMQKKAGVYRVVTAFEKLKGRNAPDSIPEVTGEVERKWVGLTEDDILDAIQEWKFGPEPHTVRDMLRSVEAKLKEKNTP